MSVRVVVPRRYLVWQQHVSSSPAEDPAISEQERQHILANTPASSQGRVESVPWGMLLSRKEVRASVGRAAGCPCVVWARVQGFHAAACVATTAARRCVRRRAGRGE